MVATIGKYTTLDGRDHPGSQVIWRVDGRDHKHNIWRFSHNGRDH